MADAPALVAKAHPGHGENVKWPLHFSIAAVARVKIYDIHVDLPG
jgi:hypothetical protein